MNSKHGKGFNLTTGLLIVVLLTYFFSLAEARISDGYIHNNHWYAVSYDGEGDAVVRAKIEIENTLREDLKYIVFEVPGQITVYKLVEEKGHCPMPVYEEKMIMPDIYPPPRPCYGGNTALDYNKEHGRDSTFLRFNLSAPLKEGERTRLMVLYKTPRNAEKSLGKYVFDFSTIIDTHSILIEHLRVSVNVENGFHLAEGGGEVDYRTDFFSAGMAQEMASKTVMEMPYDDYSRRIEYSSGYVEEASNLDAWESFHVKGSYSKSWVYTHLISVLASIAVLVGLVLAAKILVKKSRKSSKSKGSWLQSPSNSPTGRILGIGFLCAVGLIVLYFVAMLVGGLLTALPWHLREMTALFGALLVVLASIGLIVVPAIVQGKKQGVAEGFLTAGATLLWTLIIAFVISIIIAITWSPYKVIY